jgi:MFS transporter, BCD family, chlorophyll transporter
LLWSRPNRRGFDLPQFFSGHKVVLFVRAPVTAVAGLHASWNCWTMNTVSRKMIKVWASLGSRFLPFADAATPDLPLSRLLRLSLFQVAVGMSLVLLVGTLNRVMIVELKVPASIVGIMVSLPLIFAPFRALIGFKSDVHKSVLGWRRVPFLYKGTLVQFGGLAILPFALLVLSGGGDAGHAPVWIGQTGAALAFLLIGAGVHTTQTVGLALATDLASPESRPKVVGLMYTMLMLGMIVSAIVFGILLADFSPGRLIQVIQGSAVVTIVLNGIAVWKMEARRSTGGIVASAHPGAPAAGFRESWDVFIQGPNAMRRLIAVGFGTMAFSMEDVLLEPYGGQILHLSVGDTTKLTAALAVGGLAGFGLASRVLSRGADPFRMASAGALVGIPAFLAVIFSAELQGAASALTFGFGTLLIGFGAGLFGHGTLTATMNAAPKDQAGLALGAWGAVQASAAGVAIALGGILRDLVTAYGPQTSLGAAAGYDFVYCLEVVLLFATLITMIPLIRRRRDTILIQGQLTGS